jgi:hypothetical protein
MGHLAERYSHAQREGAALAYLDHGMRPARLVREALAAGRLTYDGEPVPACDMPESTILTNVTRLKNRRAGKVQSELAQLPARDAAEALKRALAAMTEQEIRALQRQKIGKRDPERIRQLARAAREIAAIPDRADPATVKPGEKIPGTQQTAGGKTTGGLAGAILAAAGQTRPRGNAREVPAPDVPTYSRDEGQGHGVRTPAHEQHHDHEHSSDGEPGSWASDQVGAISTSA